jgi:hypothetical protein
LEDDKGLDMKTLISVDVGEGKKKTAEELNS